MAGAEKLSVAVTGASRGIGRATAIELAMRGHQVFALARSEHELNHLSEDPTRRIIPLVMDITDPSSRLRTVNAILETTNGYGLDVLVNNAGYGQLGPIEEVPVEKLRRQFEVNVFGHVAFTQPFLPMMRERRRGWIVNVSSIAGRIVTPFMGAYSASKFALEALSDALRLELAPFGIHVVLIEPGPIRSAFGEAARPHTEERSTSPYAQFLTRSRATRSGVQHIFTRSPETVARVIARSIASHHPRPRYTVTIPARIGMIASHLVPTVTVDWVMRRALGLTEQPPDS